MKQEGPFMTKKEIAKKISEQSGITVLVALEAMQMVCRHVQAGPGNGGAGQTVRRCTRPGVEDGLKRR
jgi:hypothetical protein